MKQTSVRNAKRLASSPPEKNTEKLRTPFVKFVPTLQRRMSWNAYGARVANTGIVLMCVMLYPACNVIDNIVFFVLPVYNYVLPVALKYYDTLSCVDSCIVIAYIESSLSEIQSLKETV